ncbi:MAG: hypothetical protein VE98_C0001G0588 [candidate division Kazan bacterium GW2011_GWA1_50_15]|uniref:Uncharacterized protein n=2 Tax=Bacteria division Kazan-3B-28 TaxID=1798534 RepID=A0A0G2A4T8_UNCK3|nr:MAG: hypothetical protein VE98_C0001G0588 [candidate division Kazan bacterium GW2011_GWA1_50_15]KKW25726.1 MAG: hypothetical protein VE99_C0001G0365 [candidate division Kazan bacterium GW2011_GWC1_52_13]KKW27259.1 MAG: hypothetical protein VF00_C0001G0194 [candidate division Kazan bacterium GW2011_GWB1_52_7]HAV65985.1 hypothetical protein [Patescibacteria group bacterium]HCR42553.1 hypothetical protein [Patescibacteria group bacterium]
MQLPSHINRFLEWLEDELITVLAVVIVVNGIVWVNAADTRDMFLGLAVTPSPETIFLYTPDGGESWEAGTEYTISYIAGSGIDSVKIELQRSTGGSWETIADPVAVTANEEEGYDWTVTSPATVSAKIRVSSTADAAVYGESTGVFTITAEGESVLPGGGGGGAPIPAVEQPTQPSVPEEGRLSADGWWAPESYRAKLLRRSYNVQLNPGVETTLSVIALNVGNAVWYNYGRFQTKLGVVGDRHSMLATAQWEKFDRVAILDKTTTGGNELRPGQLGRFNLTIKAPLQPGVYTETFALLTEHITWFPGTEVTVRVTSGQSRVVPRSSTLADQVTPSTDGTPTTSPAPQPRVITPKSESTGFLGWLSRVWSTVTNLFTK